MTDTTRRMFDDLDVWLGPANDTITDVNRGRFYDAARDYYQLPLHTERDPQDAVVDADEDGDALAAILQSIVGEDSLERVAARARQAEAELHSWVKASIALGMSEYEVARKAGITRGSVRRWTGK